MSRDNAKIKIITLRSGRAIVYRGNDAIGHIKRNDLLGSPTKGQWKARPAHETLTVGKSFPLFPTRKKAVEWLVEHY